jgi:hypothetical protein
MMKHNYGRHLFLLPLFILAGILEIISTNAIKVDETGIEQPAIVPLCIWLIAVGLIINSILYNEFLHKKTWPQGCQRHACRGDDDVSAIPCA